MRYRCSAGQRKINSTMVGRMFKRHECRAPGKYRRFVTKAPEDWRSPRRSATDKPRFWTAVVLCRFKTGYRARTEVVADFVALSKKRLKTVAARAERLMHAIASQLRCLTGVGNRSSLECRPSNAFIFMNDYNQRRGSHDALILCTVFVVGLFIASCSKGPPGYSDFTAHDKKYYTEIAQGCETLLSRTNRTADWWIMSGDDKTLPTALQDLNATKIKVAKHLPL